MFWHVTFLFFIFLIWDFRYTTAKSPYLTFFERFVWFKSWIMNFYSDIEKGFSKSLFRKFSRKKVKIEIQNRKKRLCPTMTQKPVLKRFLGHFRGKSFGKQLRKNFFWTQLLGRKLFFYSKNFGNRLDVAQCKMCKNASKLRFLCGRRIFRTFPVDCRKFQVKKIKNEKVRVEKIFDIFKNKKIERKFTENRSKKREPKVVDPPGDVSCYPPDFFLSF